MKLDHFRATKPYWRLNAMNQAAYVEVTVIMLKISHLTGGSLLAELSDVAIFKTDGVLVQDAHVSSGETESLRLNKPTLTENCSSLLVRAVTIREVYTA